ncbi:LacI family DNA-binding transcriptional regulator [Streptomyces calidiresistens]|uniref:LacI family DNA-binding transcriptional regulator n=1 Tax=Streptomyces calidiresistens TaxID=1485586 RepID=A0A7W3XVI2_9ACTN|nr:LacI family DNA-binding transcriptional regulator [Streptomyces calidiresistens]MBB0228995.1 LacI family DNA-binding transcriptional regulator [Streptomyces calidiresistens]
MDRRSEATTGDGTATEPAGPSPAGAAGAPRPTSRDVAERAGVSQATVSLVLRDRWHGRVSPPRAEAVREAARELGYRPNLAARRLRSGGTGTVLLVVPALTNEFFARVHAGAAAVAAERGMSVVLFPSPEGIGPAPDPFASAGATLDGVIASSMASRALRALRGGGLPLVMLDSDPEDTEAAATVNPDVPDGLRRVGGHLLAAGHRRIVHLAADIDTWTFRERGRALAEELASADSPLLATARAALDVREAAAVAGKLLATRPRPTAVVCDDDVLAAGACKAARRAGLRVPEDLSVTGVDDLALATAVEPELTTVRLPAEEMGGTGMRALLEVLDGGAPGTRVLPVRFVPRGSTGPAPTGSG